MAHVSVYSGALHGVDALGVEVEVNARERGELKLSLVGLPDTAVRESIDRVLTAIGNSALRWPSAPITINLAPADLRKEGPSFDLPIAVGLVALEPDRNGEFKEYYQRVYGNRKVLA